MYFGVKNLQSFDFIEESNSALAIQEWSKVNEDFCDQLIAAQMTILNLYDQKHTKNYEAVEKRVSKI